MYFSSDNNHPCRIMLKTHLLKLCVCVCVCICNAFQWLWWFVIKKKIFYNFEGESCNFCSFFFNFFFCVQLFSCNYTNFFFVFAFLLALVLRCLRILFNFKRFVIEQNRSCIQMGIRYSSVRYTSVTNNLIFFLARLIIRLNIYCYLNLMLSPNWPQSVLPVYHILCSAH